MYIQCLRRNGTEFPGLVRLRTFFSPSGIGYGYTVVELSDSSMMGFPDNPQAAASIHGVGGGYHYYSLNPSNSVTAPSSPAYSSSSASSGCASTYRSPCQSSHKGGSCGGGGVLTGPLHESTSSATQRSNCYGSSNGGMSTISPPPPPQPPTPSQGQMGLGPIQATHTSELCLVPRLMQMDSDWPFSSSADGPEIDDDEWGAGHTGGLPSSSSSQIPLPTTWRA